MKAIVYYKYGSPEVLQLAEVDKPSIKDNELLVNIKATAVNSADWRLRKADPWAVRLFFGFFKPKRKILGGVLSGIVEATGKDVTKFKTGDEVFGFPGMSFGAYAEYKALPEKASITIKPVNMSHEEAAAIIFGGTTASHFLQKAKIQKGEKVLIYGASGAVGTAAVQIAKYYEGEVTGVCSGANTEMVRSIGADKVIDYTRENIWQSGEKFDIIFDTVGKVRITEATRSLNKKGRLILGSSALHQMLGAMRASITRGKKIISGVAKDTPESIQFLKELAEAGQLKAVIDRTYPLEQMVEAHRYVEQGHKKGNVVITI